MVHKDGDDCWLWTGYVDPAGYARFSTPGECRAHRWSYKEFVGPIPTGKVLDHVCRVRHCVRPDHLRAVTSAENTRAAGSQAPAKLLREAEKCKWGHPWTEQNTAYNKRGYRRCRACGADKGRAQRAATRTAVCVEGHTKVPQVDGRLYCPICASEVRKRGRRIDTYFRCGHRRDETAKLNRRGVAYCGPCRVDKRIGINTSERREARKLESGPG